MVYGCQCPPVILFITTWCVLAVSCCILERGNFQVSCKCVSSVFLPMILGMMGTLCWDEPARMNSSPSTHVGYCNIAYGKFGESSLYVVKVTINHEDNTARNQPGTTEPETTIANIIFTCAFFLTFTPSMCTNWVIIPTSCHHTYMAVHGHLHAYLRNVRYTVCHGINSIVWYCMCCYYCILNNW
jgi:hypothetical protein